MAKQPPSIKAWTKAAYIRTSPMVTQAIALSKNMYDDPTIWKLKDMTPRIAEAYNTATTGVSYSAILAESYALRAVSNRDSLDNYPQLVKAIHAEREALNHCWEVLRTVLEQDFLVTLHQMSEPNGHENLFNFDQFRATREHLQKQAIIYMVNESDWTGGVHAALLFLELLHIHLLSSWIAIFDLGHNAQLQIMESTGVI